MSIEQLTGKCVRLRQELAAAHAAASPHRGRIDRIAAELAAAERELLAWHPPDEQTSESMLALLSWSSMPITASALQEDER